jgi:hypothetical protein
MNPCKAKNPSGLAHVTFKTPTPQQLVWENGKRITQALMRNQQSFFHYQVAVF